MNFLKLKDVNKAARWAAQFEFFCQNFAGFKQKKSLQ